MTISELRKQYHENICKDLLRMNKNTDKGDYPNNADGDSKISVNIAREILLQLCSEPVYGNISGQKAGKIFEMLTKDFIAHSFSLLEHIRPGEWSYLIETEISHFEQYKDLAEIDIILKEHKKLAATFGQDYIIKPDIIIGRKPVSDAMFNKKGKIVDYKNNAAKLTPLRESNCVTPKQLLHASISCKWTLRSDRAQNIRTEAFNLIRNRKGKLPHIVAVTAEPTLTRIASLALGTGDIDCVYHFALDELKNAVFNINDDSQIDMFHILVEGRRLRDISDLPFDLAI
ncbi:restriction endonuclease [candidate division KSB1 bacterium]|nr:restriction endonuclease [candidate division KSB1 bacterium]